MYEKTWGDGNKDTTSNGDQIYVHSTLGDVTQTSYGPEPVSPPPPPPSDNN